MSTTCRRRSRKWGPLRSNSLVRGRPWRSDPRLGSVTLSQEVPHGSLNPRVEVNGPTQVIGVPGSGSTRHQGRMVRERTRSFGPDGGTPDPVDERHTRSQTTQKFRRLARNGSFNTPFQVGGPGSKVPPVPERVLVYSTTVRSERGLWVNPDRRRNRGPRDAGFGSRPLDRLAHRGCVCRKVPLTPVSEKNYGPGESSGPGLSHPRIGT